MGQLFGKIIMILSFRVGTSKDKNIDYRVKATCVIMSTPVTYKALFTLFTISSALNFCFLFI